MKKILLATTAIVALSAVAADASAADKIKLSLGGFMKQYVGVANNDDVSATANSGTARAVNLQQWANNEIYFRGSTKLTNGLNVSVDHQMETSNRAVGSRRLDVSSLEISSDAVGALTVGSTTHAANDYTTRAPNVGPLDYGDMATALNSQAATAAVASSAVVTTTGVQQDDLGGKGLKLKYVSPNFSGVNVFVSYAADAGNNGQIQQATNAATDTYSYGAAFGGEVGGAALTADIIHSNLDTGFDQNHFGLTVGMAGFTVGGGYTTYNDTDTGGNLAATKQNADGKAIEVGVAYEAGPFGVSATYASVKTKGTSTATQDNKDTTWTVAGAYDLGAGVAITGQYYKQKFDGEDVGTVATVANGKSVSSSGVVAGIEVGF